MHRCISEWFDLMKVGPGEPELYTPNGDDFILLAVPFTSL